MRIALLSDIHGNHYALQSVLDAVKQSQIDIILITGDFIGYYFWPAEVFELLSDWKIVAIRGNHDKMLERAKRDNSYLERITEKYGSGLSIALEKLEERHVEWLLNLPDTTMYDALDEKILLCHGSPWKNDEYIYPDAENSSLERYLDLNVSYVLQGHTHYPMAKQVGDVTIINPGSVGQPRNRQPGAHWALLDTGANDIKHFCEQYDCSRVVREARKRHPDIPYLAEILERV